MARPGVFILEFLLYQVENQEENPEIPMVICRIYTTGNVYKIMKLSSA